MNKLKKIRNRIYTVISSFVTVTFLTMSGFAQGNFANSVIVTGTKNLIADVSSWLTGIAITVTAVVCVCLFIATWHYLMIRIRNMWDKRIKDNNCFGNH